MKTLVLKSVFITFLVAALARQLDDERAKAKYDTGNGQNAKQRQVFSCCNFFSPSNFPTYYLSHCTLTELNKTRSIELNLGKCKTMYFR